MKGFRTLVQRYQSYNRCTRQFDGWLLNQDYAALLGIDPATLSRFYAGSRQRQWFILLSFLRAFPEAAVEIGPALLADARAGDIQAA